MRAPDSGLLPCLPWCGVSVWHGVLGVQPFCVTRGCSLLVMEKFSWQRREVKLRVEGSLRFCSLAVSTVIIVQNKWGLGRDLVVWGFFWRCGTNSVRQITAFAMTKDIVLHFETLL